MNDDSQRPTAGVLEPVGSDLRLVKGLAAADATVASVAAAMTCFDPLGEIENLLEDSATQAHTAGLELIGKVCHNLPRLVVGDLHRLRRVLRCLIDNAIQYTPRGEVVVELAQAREPSGDGHAFSFQVSDTGRGVGPDQLHELLTHQDGPGRQLRHAALLVGDLGGRLDVESVVGHGSTFRFTAHFATARKDQVEQLAPPPHLVGVRVLVADDNKTSRAILADLLQKWGMRATMVDGGQAALEVITQADMAGNAFEVLLLDARMPRLGGFTVVERLIEGGHYRRVIMLVSPPCRRNDDSAVTRLRITERVSKPIRRDQLLRAMIKSTAGL